uniref:COR domain-containing protein n=1 Tax=Macrostomum lignano TaxID=282301 RepID=A0A1I8JP71_9PLAT
LHKGIGTVESLASLDLSHKPQPHQPARRDRNLSKLWEMPLDGLKLSLDASLYPRSNQRTSSCWSGSARGRGKTSLLRAGVMKLKQPERQVHAHRGHRRHAVVPQGSAATPQAQKWVTYQLSCWDFAAAKKSSTPPMHSEGCDAELRRLKPWAVNIKSPGPACPVICVGTHADTLPSSGPNRDTIIANIRTRIETMIRRPGFPEIVEYVEVKRKSGDNASVERLRTVIQSALEAFKVKGHHVMGQMVPESYVKLETLVMERARIYGQDKDEDGRGVEAPVSAPATRPGPARAAVVQLRKMATDAGLNMNDEKLSQAVRFLHESGVLLHFDDSTYRLNNLYFIDPQWLCEINGFIRSGVMRQSDLGLLFTGKRITEEDRHFIFPVSQISQYLRILEKFELYYRRKMNETAHTLSAARHCGAGSRPRNLLLVVIDAASSPCAPSILKMGKRVMFACWQPPATEPPPPPQLPLTMRPSFCCKPSEEATPEAGGLQLQVPLCPNGAYLLAQIADNIDVVIEEWYPGLTRPHGDGRIRSPKSQATAAAALHQARSSSSLRCFIHFSFDDICKRRLASRQAIRCPRFAEDLDIPSFVPLSSLARMLT